jgi:hypothetical protein
MAAREMRVNDNGTTVRVVFTDDEQGAFTSLGVKQIKDLEVGDMVCIRTGTPYVEIESIP